MWSSSFLGSLTRHHSSVAPIPKQACATRNRERSSIIKQDSHEECSIKETGEDQASLVDCNEPRTHDAREQNFAGNDNVFIKVGAQLFEEPHVLIADSNFFRVFTTSLLEGDTATALEKPTLSSWDRSSGEGFNNKI